MREEHSMSRGGVGDLLFVALGGVGEIGMNMYAYGVAVGGVREWIIVDCGVTFGDMATSPGVELILPDMDAFLDRGEPIAGIFITHAHEDHIGAIGYCWPKLRAPVHCSAFAAAIVRYKFDELGIGGGRIRISRPNEPIAAGAFSVTFFPVSHSMPQSHALIIETQAGTVFHSGDFKLDPAPVIGPPTDIDALRELAKRPIAALVCDSTNALRDGHSGSESDLLPHLRKCLAHCDGAILATAFASNVARIRMLAEEAARIGRAVILVGRAMRRMVEIALRTGVLDHFPETFPEERACDLPRDRMFCLVTGSQGESRAALARIANRSHPTVRLEAGDRVLFSSKTIPGNERGVIRIYNLLAAQGVEVIHAENAPIHVSGHAGIEELRQLCAILRPGALVPVHGEQQHIRAHARHAREWGLSHAPIAPNGTLVRLAPGAATIIDRIDSGRIYIDGILPVKESDGVIRKRLRLARDGHVALALVLNGGGALLADAEIELSGVPDLPNGTDRFADRLAVAVEAAVDAMPARDRNSDNAVRNIARGAVRRLCLREWGKKPQMSVLVTRLEE